MQKKVQINEASSIDLKEKMAFSGISFGSTLISESLATFALYYFTDILLLPAASISIILFSVHMFDSAVDPFIGYYIDKRTTRHGKYLGYIYYWTPVFCMLYIGLFLPISFSRPIRVALCFILYMLFSAAFSIAQVARNPLLVAMTCDQQERQLLNTIRTTSGITATIVIQYFMLKMVSGLGGESEQLGFTYTAIIFSAVAVLVILTGVRAIKERNIAKNNHMGMLESLKLVMKSKEVVFIFLMIFANYTGISVKAQAAIYYMKYFIDRQDLTSVFLLVGIGSSLLMQPVIVYAAKRYSNQRLIFTGSIGGALSMLLIGFADTSLPLLMCGNILFGITTAFPANLITTYTANISDVFSKEQDASFNAIINSTVSLAGRMGYSVAGAIIALVLHFSAYQPNTEQTGSALFGIQVTFVLITCLSYVGVAVSVACSQKLVKSKL